VEARPGRKTGVLGHHGGRRFVVWMTAVGAGAPWAGAGGLEGAAPGVVRPGILQTNVPQSNQDSLGASNKRSRIGSRFLPMLTRMLAG